VLGRAVAHEIGHYLLATATHANRGLMRASIDASEFADPWRQNLHAGRRRRQLAAPAPDTDGRRSASLQRIQLRRHAGAFGPVASRRRRSCAGAVVGADTTSRYARYNVCSASSQPRVIA
jgi:hypothetical protein